MGKFEDSINNIVYKEKFPLLKENIKLNKPYIKNTINKIYYSLLNKTFVIVGAGPSLDKNINILKRYEENGSFIIIYVDMALKPGIKAGLKPEYVITAEGIDINYWDDIDTTEMSLIAAVCSAHKNIMTWKGDIYFYSWLVDGKFNELWEMVPNVPQLPTGGIVTSVALSLAIDCFANNVVFIGNDLAYEKDYQYCKGAIGEGWNKYEYIIKQNGKEYFTTGNFAIAKMWMENFIDKHKEVMYFFDLSEPGLFNAKKLMAENDI